MYNIKPPQVSPLPRQLLKVRQFLVPCSFSDVPQTGQCPVSMADVRHTKLSVLSTVLRDSHDTLTLGMGEGDGEGGGGGG